MITSPVLARCYRIRVEIQGRDIRILSHLAGDGKPIGADKPDGGGEASPNPNALVFEDQTFFSLHALFGSLIYLWQKDGDGEYTQLTFHRETVLAFAKTAVEALSTTPAPDAGGEFVIPDGMTRWLGTYGAPHDVDHQKPVARRDGRLTPTPITGNQWLHVASHADADIVAYTPKASTPAPVVRGEGEEYPVEHLPLLLRQHVPGVLECEAEPHVIADAVAIVRQAADVIAAALSPAQQGSGEQVAGLVEALTKIRDYSGGTQYSTIYGMRGIAKDTLAHTALSSIEYEGESNG